MPVIFTRQSALSSELRAEKESRRHANAFSLSRAISSLSHGYGLDGYEAEVVRELNRAVGGGASSLPLPLELLADPSIRPDYLARDLSKATLSAGGALVGAEKLPVADLLAPWSVAAQAGVTVLSLTGDGDVSIPKTSASMTGYWLTNEATAVTQSDLSLGVNNLSPKNLGTYTKFSRQLLRQSNIGDALLQQHMLALIGRTFDAAILTGSGASGQPTGIENTASVNATTGAFSLTTALTMEENAATQGASDNQVGFVTTPAVRRILKARTPDAGSAGELIWRSSADGDTLAGRRAHVANYAPSATVYCGPWNDCVLAVWGVPMLELNPYDPTDFKSGMVGARMMLSADVAFLHPTAWSKHSALV